MRRIFILALFVLAGMVQAFAVQASTPVIALAAGTYTSAQETTITTSTGPVICWNTVGAPATNGSTGCTVGTHYTGAATIAMTSTIYAVAGGTGFTDSAVASTAYIINIAQSALTSTYPFSGTVIPASLFGLATAGSPFNIGSWPTVSFGAIAKPTETGWTYIEPTLGTFNWTTMDQDVIDAASKGLPVHWAFGDAPLWAVNSNGSGGSNTTSCSLNGGGFESCTSDVTDLPDQATFFAALATRYNGLSGHGFIALYTFYTEPDNFYTGDKANLAAQTTALYNAIRANSPSSKIANLCVDYPDTYYSSGNYMDLFWAAGGKKTTDYLCFHDYPHHGNDVPEIINTFVPFINAAVTRNSVPAQPILMDEGSWGDITEIGWQIVDPVQQAAWVARTYLLAWANGVSEYDWYGWGFAPWGDISLSSVPTNAYQQVYNWMVGAVMPTQCAVSGTVWTCPLNRPGVSQNLAVWNTSGNSTYTPASQYAQYSDLTGATNPISGTVTIGLEPVLLQAPAPPTITAPALRINLIQ